ncbi:hypothetical protein FPCIR_2630 [Fusarium pseudocircinatum]|uniref:Uncharacterized protein n=1 Tax=Fusarium pseudocircinatum TaxID=56676 RepID=A0A8H5UVM3_9HYPO|nr:hypothetical protein FPCIR_2630 [Fusarium pseudocircinatum]
MITGRNVFKAFDCVVPEFPDAGGLLQVHVEAVQVLEPRTARDYRQGFEDVRCLPRIAKAIKELLELVEIPTESKVNDTFRSKYADLVRLLKEDLVEANLRDVRLVTGGGGVGASKELLLTPTKICGISRARWDDLDHCPGIVYLSGSLSDTQRQIPAMYAGNEGGQPLKGSGVTTFSVQNGEHSNHRRLYHLDNALLSLAGVVESVLRHLRHLAFYIMSASDHKAIYRDEEHENIDEIFLNHHVATHINFIESPAIDMMGLLPQLDEMCILPNGLHFFREKRLLGDGPISGKDLL